MQRVVRSTFAILTLAGLAACGDKVTVLQPDTTKPAAQILSIAVVPSTLNLTVGQTANLTATVTAEAGFTGDRSVTWTSANTAVATVSAAGVVTAVAPGSIAVVAKSVANTNITGAAAVTVVATPPVTVSIATINQGVNNAGAVVGVPADLTNAVGQLDITLNVDSGNQPLRSVTTILKCGTDSIVQTQTISAAAAELAAEEAAAPITLSVNTAAFNQTTGGVGGAANPNTVRNNSACTIRAIATTTSGTQSASGTTTLAVNNADFVLTRVTIANEATDPNAVVWYGPGAGANLSVQALPVLYSGRTAVAANIGLNNLGVSTTASGNAPYTVTFPNVPAATNTIYGVTDPNERVLVNITDNQGNTFGTANGAPVIITLISTSPATTITPPNQFPQQGGFIARFNLDTRKPAPGVFPLPNNAAQGTAGTSGNVYIGAAFRFDTTKAAGYCGPSSTAFTPANYGTTAPVCTGATNANTDFGGVDKVSVVFQSATANTGTFTTLTNTSALSETNVSTTNILRQITTDAVGNADTSFADGTAWTSGAGSATVSPSRFGVDKTAPTADISNATPKDQALSQAVGGTGNYVFAFNDNLSGPGLVYVAQIRNYNSNASGSDVSLSTIEGMSASNLCGQFGLPALSATPGANLCVTPTTASDRTQASTSPCVIGRFNATQAASGTGSVQAFNRDGAALGWCTPVPYALAGNSTLPTNATPVAGYFKTTVTPSDVAGNRGTTFTATVGEDDSNPTVTALDLPGQITGNASTSFGATVADNGSNTIGDLMSTWPTLTYANAMVLRFANTPITGAVAFDNVLTRGSLTTTATISNFIKNVKQGAPFTAVTAISSADNVTDVTIGAVDESGRVGTRTGNFAAAGVTISAGSTSSWSTTTFTTGVFIGATNSTIWNCPSATTCGAGANTAPSGPTSTVLSMAAAGTTGTFNNPFTIVTFWYQNGAGQWVQIGSSTTGVASDNGVNRIWTYSFTWDPPAVGPDGTNLTPVAGGTINLAIRAIGVNSAGDGISTATGVITLSNQ